MERKNYFVMKTFFLTEPFLKVNLLLKFDWIDQEKNPYSYSYPFFFALLFQTGIFFISSNSFLVVSITYVPSINPRIVSLKFFMILIK